MTFNAPVYGVAGNIHGNQNVHASEQKQSLAEEERQEAQTVLKKKVIIEPNPIYPPLSEIPVTGDEASEVGADYTKLRDFLERREFGKADLETARKILWVAKREQEGWLDLEDIENFPRQDLLAINQLWLVASEGKFGFSVQKQIWVNLGGQPGQYNLSVFNRFIKKVKWAENRIVLDQRAAKGHLPVGVFVKVSDDVRINQKWWVEIDKIARIESEEIEREKKRIRSAKRHFEKAEGEHMEQSLQQEMVYRWGWSWVRRGGSRFAVAAMRYLSLLSRDDL